MKRAHSFFIMLMACWLIGSGVLAQDSDRGGRRWRGRNPFDMTDEERAEMYDRRVAHYHEHFVEDYELTDEQSAEVKAQLEKVKAEHQAYMEPRREEFRKTGQELHDMFHKRRAGEEVDSKRMYELMDRMREMRDASPLMNSEIMTRQVEALLPAEQVARGRVRAEQRHAEMRRRWENRGPWRQRGEDGRDRSRRGRDSRGDRGRGRFSRGDRWDRYFEDFKQRYQLDASQAATAESILRQLKKQRDAHIANHQAELDAIRSLEDRDQRWNAYRELTAPTDALFDLLRNRLNQVLTRAQRAAGGSMPEYWDRNRFSPRRRGPETRPADSATRPADG